MTLEEENAVLKQQLVKSATFGQQLLAENAELKQRATEDAEQLNVLKGQVAKLEEINGRIVAESAEELNLHQRQNVADIAELTEKVAEFRREVIEVKSDRSKLRAELEEVKQEKEQTEKNHKMQIQQMEQTIEQLKLTSKEKVNCDKGYIDEIQSLKVRETTLASELEAKSIELYEQTQKLATYKKAIQTFEEQLVSLRQEKKQIELENTKLSEQNDDLQLAAQLASHSLRGESNAPDIEGQGNSLFSEVEDQRAKTASELRVLEETYRSKIHRFDALEAELKQKQNENNELLFKVSSAVATEANCKRLCKEIQTLREERDILLQSGGGGGGDGETQRLKEQLNSILMTKNIQHDAIRRLNEQINDLEKENMRLKHELRQSRLDRLGTLQEQTIKSPEQKAPTPEKKIQLGSELPSDEEHRQALLDFKQDVEENKCNQQ